MRNNAFPKGQKWHFECAKWHTPAPIGVHLNPVTLVPEMGPETVLILREKRKFMNELRQFGPLTLNIKSGAVRTSAGPVVFMTWWFPPIVACTPYASYELLLSPLPQSGISQLIEEISRQTHIHLVIFDENHEIFDVVEFENVYNLGGLLNLAHEIGAHLKNYTFDEAKQAFFQEFSMERLMAL
ncbi:MAG: hypothetical protein KGK08_03195 [Acidobacteriota bacterium]|nr:hypothetical protein [Acidobacteriota bacterium]